MIEYVQQILELKRTIFVHKKTVYNLTLMPDDGIILILLDLLRKNQGFKGITQWLINLCTYSMMIHKITPPVDYN